jgi:hypothetical protein
LSYILVPLHGDGESKVDLEGEKDVVHRIEDQRERAVKKSAKLAPLERTAEKSAKLASLDRTAEKSAKLASLEHTAKKSAKLVSFT